VRKAIRLRKVLEVITTTATPICLDDSECQAALRWRQ